MLKTIKGIKWQYLLLLLSFFLNSEKITFTIADVRAAYCKTGKSIQEKASLTEHNFNNKGRQILNKALKASGGLKAVKAILSRKTIIKITQDTQLGEMTFPGEFITVYPDQMWSKIILPAGEVVMVYTTQSAWIFMADRGFISMPENERNRFKNTFLRDPVIFFGQMDLYKIQYLGTKNLGEKEMEDLLLYREGAVFHLLIDPQSQLPAGIVYTENTQQGPMEVEEIFLDYKSVNGFQMPMRTISNSGGKKISESIRTQCEVNVEVDPTLFEKQ